VENSDMAFNARKMKVYAKLTGIGLLTLFVVLFMASNTAPVKVKFLWKDLFEVPTYTFGQE
jgi:uncharacterized integral membrane protein